MQPSPPSSWKIASATGPDILIISLPRKDFAPPISINSCARRAGFTASPKSRPFRSIVVTAPGSNRTLLPTSQPAKSWARWNGCSDMHSSNKAYSMKELVDIFVLPACMLVATLAPLLAQTGEIGIDRSNLTRESQAVQQKTLEDIHALHATWFRHVLSAGTPQNIAAFVNEIKLAKENGLKFLANVLPSGADYARRPLPPSTLRDNPVYSAHCRCQSRRGVGPCRSEQGRAVCEDRSPEGSPHG
jgi:hypothetical protein